jgi:hypothetical protein
VDWLFDVLARIWTDLLARPSGPFAFRFVLQPVMATIAGIKDGLQDARTGRPPYFRALLTGTGGRWALLREGLKATARIILLGIVMDVAYQYVALERFYPAEAVDIALLLAFVPYVLVRGPVSRLARRGKGASRESAPGTGRPRV